MHMRVAVKSHALPVFKNNRIASLLCIFETIIGVLYAWMSGYNTMLHNIAHGKYIVIKVGYGLQLHFKTFLNKSDRKNDNKSNH